jgi:hypothetical protein
MGSRELSEGDEDDKERNCDCECDCSGCPDDELR